MKEKTLKGIFLLVAITRRLSPIVSELAFFELKWQDMKIQ
jgi:hypothetical protein